MKCLFAISMAATALLFPYGRAVGFADPDLAPVSANVNEKYRVESVALRNWRGFVSRGLLREMKKLEGRPFRAQSVEALAKRVQYEFPGYRVEKAIQKGSRPEYLRVLFDLERSRRTIDLRSPRALYSTASAFSVGADASFETGPLSGTFGFITDNDERVERFTGYRGGLLVPLDKNGRFRFGLLGETYRSQWNRVLEGQAGLYRSRNNIEPSVIVNLRPGLDLQAGFSFHRLEMYPTAAGGNVTPGDLAANAFFTTLRYTRQWQHGLAGAKTLDAGYGLRAAANSLGADYSYRRHVGEARFSVATSDAPAEGVRVSVSALSGGIEGNAPILDRFVLGNSRTLRGWNRFALSPTGGSRMAHLSLDAQYQRWRFCYDSGTIWDAQRPKVIRHSAGLGLTVHGWTAMIAVPLRGGSIEPVFLLGMNF